MPGLFRPTLGQVVLFSLLGLFLGLALLFYLVLNGSQKTLLQSSQRYRELASREVGRRVTAYLDEAPLAVDHFEKQIRFRLIDPRAPASVENALFALLVANDAISEASLTYADSAGFDRTGRLQTVRSSEGQVAVSRTTSGSYLSRRTWFDRTRFVSTTSDLPRATASTATPTVSAAMDPTDHLTFQTPASRDFYGQLIPTDLHWSQLDEALPERQRRIEVSVLKTVEDASGHFAGVLRIGLMKTQIDGAVQMHLTGPHESDPHLIFLCDSRGRLITGFGNRDRVVESDDDLRIDPHETPAAVAAALRQPFLRTIDFSQPVAAGSFLLHAQTYLCTFHLLPGTLGWIVGVVVPQDFYLGRLAETRRDVLEAALLVMAAIVLTGSLIVQRIVRAHSLIVRETSRMNSFAFSASRNRSFLRDVQGVLDGLERAKTAMRSMSKYVPIDLVRRLYHDGREPALGGATAQLSVLFTDIAGFTAFAEETTPDELARFLGLYLQTMATILQRENGTIDKYIGDSVMAFWNAPEPVPHHEILACRAVLSCQAALRRLYNSGDWGSFPRFETRFGLHRCEAIVGHFGAPDRFNYTAIGDGINLASRLESLNKHYGTTVIVSEDIRAAVAETFAFRLLDRVAVQGKVEGVTIYELLGDKSTGQPPPDGVRVYEQAFGLYQKSDFAGALALLARQSRDGPSRHLAGRCRDFLQDPPPADWNGIFVRSSK